MGDGCHGPRQFTGKKKIPRVVAVEHPCQSCGDDSDPWLLQLHDWPTRPDRTVWLCHQCSPRYLESATRDYGSVALRFQGY